MRLWIRLGLGGLVIGGALAVTQVKATIEPGPLPPKYTLPQEIYLKRCASCHIALPPEVLPSQTWQVLITDPSHYGTTLNPLGSLERQLMWQYLKDYSRSVKENEATPYFIADARFFKALHPKVVLPRPLRVGSCTQCHVQAPQGKFQAMP